MPCEVALLRTTTHRFRCSHRLGDGWSRSTRCWAWVIALAIPVTGRARGLGLVAGKGGGEGRRRRPPARGRSRGWIVGCGSGW